MCLAIPGRVSAWLDRDASGARASVEFGGVRREVCMACVPDAREGDYVLVHAGIAITIIDADEARRTLAAFEELELRETLEEMRSSDPAHDR